jgi:hypothetical protein
VKDSGNGWSFVVWPLAALPLLSGCSLAYAKFGHPEVQVRRDLPGLKVEADPVQPETLVVSGRIPHSSWGISDMRLLREKDVIVIQMHMKHGGFGRTNLTDRFSYRIDIPPDVNCVKIGKERKTIWARSAM